MIRIETFPGTMTRTDLRHIEHRTMLLSLLPFKIHINKFARV